MSTAALLKVLLNMSLAKHAFFLLKVLLKVNLLNMRNLAKVTFSNCLLLCLQARGERSSESTTATLRNRRSSNERGQEEKKKKKQIQSKRRSINERRSCQRLADSLCAVTTMPAAQKANLVSQTLKTTNNRQSAHNRQSALARSGRASAHERTKR